MVHLVGYYQHTPTALQPLHTLPCIALHRFPRFLSGIIHVFMPAVTGMNTMISVHRLAHEALSQQGIDLLWISFSV